MLAKPKTVHGRGFGAAVFLMVGSLPAFGQLVLTEVDFESGTIELTNVGDEAFPGNSLNWCVPFIYGNLESGGFNFAPGEVRTYSISFPISPSMGNDLWIYMNNLGFNNESEVITGVVWGSSQRNQGRTNAVVNESDAWDSNTDFVPTDSVPVGSTLQLMPGSPSASTSASWVIAPANLGTYQISVDVDLQLGIRPGPAAGEVTLFWPVTTPDTTELQETMTPENGVSWLAVVGTPTVVGETNELVLTADGRRFFRLSD